MRDAYNLPVRPNIRSIFMLYYLLIMSAISVTKIDMINTVSNYHRPIKVAELGAVSPMHH